MDLYCCATTVDGLATILFATIEKHVYLSLAKFPFVVTPILVLPTTQVASDTIYNTQHSPLEENKPTQNHTDEENQSHTWRKPKHELFIKKKISGVKSQCPVCLSSRATLACNTGSVTLSVSDSQLYREEHTHTHHSGTHSMHD